MTANFIDIFNVGTTKHVLFASLHNVSLDKRAVTTSVKSTPTNLITSLHQLFCWSTIRWSTIFALFMSHISTI